MPANGRRMLTGRVGEAQKRCDSTHVGGVYSLPSHIRAYASAWAWGFPLVGVSTRNE
jgi:hypothetical protein